MAMSVNNAATDVATAASAACTGGDEYACAHIVVACKTVTAAKLKAAAPVWCKDATKDAEFKGCIKTAECVSGAWVLTDTQKTDTWLAKTDFAAAHLTTNTCAVDLADKFVTPAAASTAKAGEDAKDKAADDKAGEDAKGFAYLFGVAAIALLW
jgi:hypothetical protein